MFRSLCLLQKKSCDFTEPPNSPELNKHGLANLFLGCTIVFATSAFGMGVDCSNVHQVIHLGVTEDIESYI